MFQTLRDRYFQNERIKDHDVDLLFPQEFRRQSRIHWTPFSVAERACDFLVSSSKTRVLDVGAGLGKFCIVGALTTDALFTGVEIRENLAKAAQNLIRQYFIPRVCFLNADCLDIDWSEYDSFYLFNPFHEHRDTQIRIDNRISFGSEKFYDWVEAVQIKLQGLKVGSRVLTYHGLGGEMPSEFELIFKEPIGTGVLEAWERLS